MTDTLLDMSNEKKAPETDNARIRRDIMRKVRVIAPKLDMTVPEYLADRLAPLVDADYAAIAADMMKEVGKGRRKSD